MDNGQEIIWVTEEQAEEWKKLNSSERKESIFMDFLARKRRDIESELEQLEEDVVKFKAIGLSYKNKLGDIYDAQTDAIYNMWKVVDDKNKELKEKLEHPKKMIEGMTKEIKEIKKAVESVNFYHIERLHETLDKFNGMSDKDKELFGILLENSRRD